MELTHVVFVALIATASAQNDTPFGSTVSPAGPYHAEISLWWREYPCNSSASYDVTVRLGSAQYTERRATANLTVSGRPWLPIAYWNEYDILVNVTCANKTTLIQEFHVNTGPGGLLPLTNLSLVPDNDAVSVVFEKLNAGLQNAAENIEIVVSDSENKTSPTTTMVPMKEDHYRLERLDPGTLYYVSARLTKSYNGLTYTSEALTRVITLGQTDEPRGIAYNVTGNGPNASISLTWGTYPCNETLTHSLTFCLNGVKCIGRLENSTKYVLGNEADFPVVYWNSYYVNIVRLCAGLPVDQQQIYASTGPGELLPLQTLSAVPDGDAVYVTFETVEETLQNAAENAEFVICDVSGSNCSDAKRVPVKRKSLRISDGLSPGVLYNISAWLTKDFEGKNYTSAALTSFFTLGEIEDETGLAFNVTKAGPNAEINLTWLPYPCNGSITYNLTFCLVGFNCIDESTVNKTSFVLRSRSTFPVVFWNSYYTSVQGSCDGAFVKQQEIYVNTGPGELLPLRRLSVAPEETTAEVFFETFDKTTQNAAEYVEIVLCEGLDTSCANVTKLPINEASYKIPNLKLGKQYTVLARLTKDFDNRTYSSLQVRNMFTTESVGEYPPVAEASVAVEEDEMGNSVRVTVKGSTPADTHGKVFVGIYVQLFDAHQNSSVDSFSSETEELTIPNLPLHETFTVSVHATYTDRELSYTKQSIGRNVTFFTGVGDATRSGFNVTANGPNAEINIWWEKFPCPQGSATYQVTACLEGSCIDKSTSDTKFVLKSGFRFPVIFWNFYRIVIEAICSGSSIKVQEFYASTGPGELLPLQMLTAVVNGTTVNVEYVKPNKLSQNAAENVEIILCDVLEPMCFNATKVSIGETGRRFEDLKLGVLYNVSARLTKELQGVSYASQAQSVTFSTAYPDEENAPPVENPSVTMEPSQREGYTQVAVSCSQPTNTTGKTFRGIYVELFDQQTRENRTFNVPGVQVKIPDLPLYRMFTVTVHALYDVDNDAVQSIGRQLSFVTHVGDVIVPKPANVRLIPVNGSSVLVGWDFPRTSIYSFKITQKQISNNGTKVIDVLPARTRSLLLRDLRSEEKYSISVTAYLQSDHRFENSSEVREVTTLPKNALVPVLTVKDLKPKFTLELTWKALISTEALPKCEFLALACPDDRECKEMRVASNLKSVAIDIDPYTNYTLRVRTRCSFEDNMNIIADSNVVQYDAAALAPVANIHQHPIDKTTVALNWTVSPGNDYSRFDVHWSLVGSGQTFDSEAADTSFNLTDLEPASSYNVRIEGLKEISNRVWRSQPTSTVVYSWFPVPEEIFVLTASQKPLAGSVSVSWQGVHHEYAEVRYRVVAICGSTETYWTTATEIEFKPGSITARQTDCFVSVDPCVEDLRKKMLCAPTTGETFIYVIPPEPADVQVEYSTDTIYNVTITIPPEWRNRENLEFQVTDGYGRYGERVNGRSVAIISENAFDKTINRTARLCINDLCGLEKEFSFITNTGPPGMVSGLKVDVDVTSLKITWRKPNESNGPIDGYLVKVTETGTDNTVLRDSKENLTLQVDEEYTSYDVSVRAYNLDKNDKEVKKLGLERTTTIITEGTVPPPPQSLEVFVTNGNSRIQWEAARNPRFNVTWFMVVATPTQGDPQISFVEYPVFEFSGLKPYMSYLFRVSSCTGKMETTCGRSTSLTTFTDVGHPSSPTVQLVSANDTSIAVRWTIPEYPLGPINGYEYAYIEKSSGRTPTSWTRTLPEDRGAILSELTPNTEYEINVRAFNLNMDIEPLYSTVGVLIVTTKGGSSGALWIALLSILCVIALCGVAYYGYTRYVQKMRNTPLISVGPQTHSSPDLEEVDL